MLIDTHCHIQFKAFYDDVEDVISRCHEKDMILNLVGTQAETSKKAVEWAEKYDWMYASVGLHPIQEYKTHVEEEADTFITRGEQFDYEYYKKLALHPKTIGIGETGLDRFHIPKNIDAEIVMNKQKETFLQHVRLAQEVNKPLIVHIREAHDDMEEVIRNLKFEIRNSNPVGVIHCFTGNWQQAQTYLNAGFFIGSSSVLIKHVGERYADQYNAVVLPAYTVVDLKLAKKMKAITIELMIDNLLDAKYSEAVGTYFNPATFAAEPRNYPMPGRRYSIGVQWEI